MKVNVNWKVLFRIFIIAYLFYDIIILPHSWFAKGFMFAAIIIIIINECIRQLFFKQNKEGISNIGSICFTITALGVFMFFVPMNALTFYFTIYTLTIFHIKSPKKKYTLMAYHFIVYCIYVFHALYQNGYFTYPSILNHGIVYFTNYFEILLITVLIYKVIAKQNRITKLNKELTAKIKELESYTQVVKDLTLAEERNRIAQNLHDMMGHSLIAINMHLDVMDKLLDSDGIKAHELLNKCQEITKVSIHDLRQTVHALKESHLESSLHDSLQQLAENIEVGGKVQIQLDLFDGADDLEVTIKDAIYKIGKEAITNGIKHGDSTQFNIRLFCSNDRLHFIIKDNGCGTDTIKPSNGFIGIKQKVQLLHGDLNFDSTPGQGFTLQVAIPYHQEEKHDKNHDCG